jgi:hypothetical protein
MSIAIRIDALDHVLRKILAPMGHFEFFSGVGLSSQSHRCHRSFQQQLLDPKIKLAIKFESKNRFPT